MDAETIYRAVLAAMQPAEEMQGLEWFEYLRLMDFIEREAQNRARAYQDSHPSEYDKLRKRNQELRDALSSLIEWDAIMGGRESKIWDKARKVLEVR